MARVGGKIIPPGQKAKNLKFPLTKPHLFAIISLAVADVAHPVERHLAKVEVASSSLVIRSILLMPIKFNWHFFDRASVQFNTAP